jgi:predicted methyltransferase
MTGPLLTLRVHETLRAAARAGAPTVECSLDLERSTTTVEVGEAGWSWQGQSYPWLESCKDRTIYYWTGEAFEPVARFTTSLIKLVPTEWGPPTFEIDGIKMLATAQVSPYADAQRKVGLIQPRGKVILDTCGGLGYFAAWCLQGQASQVLSYEKNPDVIWLRSLNPWSPAVGGALTLTEGDISERIATLPAASVDAVLHDPPRFGIAGELYSQVFYDHLARVLKRKGRLFHYTGAPNRLASGRDVPNEVAKRLRHAGFDAELNGDGVLAVKKRAI